jgi:hypothetical protein
VCLSNFLFGFCLKLRKEQIQCTGKYNFIMSSPDIYCTGSRQSPPKGEGRERDSEKKEGRKG